jgi:tetratricopeptide (TPR) repeat protein
MSVIDQALQANSEDAAAYMAKMALQGRMGDVKGAASTAQLAMSRISGNADLLDAAGRALAQAGDFQQAINVFSQLVQLRPRSPTPYLRQVDLHTRRGDTAAAKAALARAFEIDPQSPDVIDQYLAQAARSRDPKPALDVARQLQRRSASQPFGWAMEGDIHAQRKDWSAAIAAYRSAMTKTDAPGPLVRRVHAILQSAQGAPAGRPVCQRMAVEHPKGLHVPGVPGLAGDRAKNYPLAERRFREALEVAPESLATINNLAWLLAERGDKQAVDMARRALAKAPRSAIVLDTLAKALASQGDVAAAVDASVRPSASSRTVQTIWSTWSNC